MRKWLSIMLAIILLFSMVLSACSGGSESATGNSEQSSTESSGDSKTDSDIESKEPAKSTEPVKLTVFINSGTPYPKGDDPILPKLNENLNMNMEFNAVTADYEQQLNVRLAGGSPPDLFQVNKEQLQTFSRQGLLLDLEPYLDQMPNVKEAYTADILNTGRADGKLYSLAKLPYMPYDSYLIRKDWLEALDLQMPKTLEDLKAVAHAFTYDDPDGNGKQDTYGITSKEFESFKPIFTNYGTSMPGSYLIEDNKVVYATTSPAMKEALTFIKELIADGVVDPEIMANQGLKHQEKAIAGKVGIIYINYFDIYKVQYAEQIKEVNPNAEWVQVDALKGPAGQYQGPLDIGKAPGWYAIPKSLEKTPEKLDKVLEFLNYVTGKGDGQKLVSFGIEGTHYKVENGKIVKLPAMDELSYTWMIQITGRDDAPYQDVKFPEFDQYSKFASQQPRLKTYESFIPAPEGVVVGDKTRFELEELTKFIYGSRPLSEFDDFVNTLNTTYQLPLYMKEAEKSLKDLGYIK